MALLGFASTMILTRILSQQVYAMYGLFASFHTAITMFVSFGYDSSYMRFYYTHPYTPKKYLMVCLRIPLIIFAGVALLMLEPGQHIVTYIFGEPLPYLILLGMIVYFFFSVVFRFSHLTARMEGYAGNYTLSNIVGKSSFLIVLLLIFFMTKNVSFDWVVFSFLITTVCGLFINAYVLGKISSSKNEFGEPITNKNLLKYGFPLMLNNVLVLAIPVIEKLIIRDLAGWDVLSIYTAASVFQTVVLLLVNTISNIWSPLVFKHCEDEKKFKPIIHTFGLLSTIVLTVGTAFCILLRRWLVLILDKNYYSVYTIAPTIFLAACFNILFVIYSVGINIKKKNIYLVFAPILQLVISIILCFLLIPHMGLVGVGLSVLISVGTNRLYSIIVGLKLYGTEQKETKVVLLIVLSIATSVISLFKTTLISDILLFFALIFGVLLVINKELKSLLAFSLSLFKKSKG